MSTLKWGILGSGLICQDFARAMKQCEHDNQIVAVGARKGPQAQFQGKSKSQIFKETCELDPNTTVYESYEEVLRDPNVDVVYIGLIHHQHREWVIKALDHGKHVLCEKPFATTYKEVKEMIVKAKEKKLFCMEAFWSRCFPAYKFLKEEIEQKKMGGVRSVFVNFGLDCLGGNRLDPKHGASPLNDIGCYAIGFALYILGNEKPDKISALGRVDHGCDIWSVISLEYPDGRKAVLTYSAEDFTPIDAMIRCDRGRYHIPENFFAPIKVVRYEIKKQVRGNTRDIEEKSFDFDNFESDKTPYNFVRASGLRYEADHVYECITNGLTESNLVPHDDTLLVAQIMDEVRKQLGVVYGQDEE